MRPGMDRVPSGARGEGGEKAAPAGVQGWQESGGTGGTGGLWRGGVIPQHLRHSWKQEGVAGTESLQALKKPNSVSLRASMALTSAASSCISIPFLSSLTENHLHLLLGPFQSPRGAQTSGLPESPAAGAEQGDGF